MEAAHHAATRIQARWRGCRTRARVVDGLRREFEARCAALEPDGGARVEWRRAGMLCAPHFPPCAPAEEPPLEDCAAGHAEHSPPGADERREAVPEAAAAGVEARRRALEEELAWAQAALAARRAQLRDGRASAAID